MMRKKYLSSIFFILFIIWPNFGFHPNFRDEFYIENQTNERLVVVFEYIGLEGPRLGRIYFDYHDEKIPFLYIRVNEPSKEFRIIEPGQKIEIGYTEHNNEIFDNLSSLEKFSFFFKYILLFNDRGDLKYRIDNFSKSQIQSVPGYLPGVFILVID
jgi:hypothetical protein